MALEPSMPPRATPSLLHSALLGSLGLLLLVVCYWNFRAVHEYEFLRTNVLVAEIAAGVGAAACFGGSIHFINVALTAPLRWFARLPLFIEIRAILLLQLVAAGIVVGSFGLMIFQARIPGPDYSYLYRDYIPPPEPPSDR